MIGKKSAGALAAALMLALTPAVAHAGDKGGGKPPTCKKGQKRCPPPPSCKKNPKKCPPALTGRMTGGGSIFGTNAFRTTHGFQIRCGDPAKSNLQVNWDSGEHFHATSFTNLVCNGPATDKPDAPFSVLTGQAEGLYNGDPATAEFRFVDNSEPGTPDTARITIFDENGDVVLFVEGTLQRGNHQAHAV